MSIGLFIQEFFRRPWMTASIAPSSRALVQAMLAPIDFEQARVIVEFGPGTGPMTKQILKRLAPDGLLLVFETNPDFVEHLRLITDTRLQICPVSAERAAELLAHRGASADAVVSSLPLSVFGEELRHGVLSAARDALFAADGVYTQFKYGASMLDLEPLLRAYFPEVCVNAVPFSLPPALVYTCSGLDSGWLTK